MKESSVDGDWVRDWVRDSVTASRVVSRGASEVCPELFCAARLVNDSNIEELKDPSVEED